MVRALASGLLVSVVSLLAASGRALAGHVLVVDAGGSGSCTDIERAVNAAVDGDAILVKSGSYAGIYIGDKTLSIVADTGAVVVVQGQVSVNYLSANRSVLVAGLQIGSVNSSAVWIRYSPGGVRLHDCTIVGADNASATCSDGWRGVEIESSKIGRAHV